MKAVYPTIFTQTQNAVLIEVPDLEILTEGKNKLDAIEMARDAIGLKGITLEDMELEIPKASELENIDLNLGTFVNEGYSYISLVDVNFEEYRRRVDNKAVRRNVTLPNWLNREAEKANINVSRVLQEALMAKLNVSQ